MNKKQIPVYAGTKINALDLAFVEMWRRWEGTSVGGQLRQGHLELLDTPEHTKFGTFGSRWAAAEPLPVGVGHPLRRLICCGSAFLAS